MKKSIVVIALSSLLFVACKNESAEREKVAQANIDSYSKTWDLVVNEGKVDVLDSAYAPEIVLHTVPEIKGIAYCVGSIDLKPIQAPPVPLPLL